MKNTININNMFIHLGGGDSINSRFLLSEMFEKFELKLTRVGDVL